MRRVVLLMCVAMVIGAGLASAQLNPGDIAIIGFNSDDPDQMAFVALVDIPMGTEIKFTDNGWFAATGFRANEGTFTWTAPSLVPAGTIVNPAVSGVAFSTSGDQILAYQGLDATPTFIYAIQFNGASWDADATNANTSAIPTGLVNGTTAVAVGNVDDGIYAGSTTSTSPAEMLGFISNSANWTTSNSPLTMPTGSYSLPVELQSFSIE